MNINEQVEDFVGKTNDGDWRLSDYRGKTVVVYFYPRDNTPGCTTQGNEFNDLLEDFEKNNTVIVGVSNDSLKKHENFCKKFDFKFQLIADEDTSISQKFGVYQLKKFMGKENMGIVRSTFVINKDGILIKEWRKVTAKGNAQETLEFIQSHLK